MSATLVGGSTVNPRFNGLGTTGQNPQRRGVWVDFQNSRVQQTKSVSFRIGRCCLLAFSCLHVDSFTVVYERPRFSNILQCFIVVFFMPFTVSSQRNGSEKRKRPNLSTGAKLELIKKLESGISVAGRKCYALLLKMERPFSSSTMPQHTHMQTDSLVLMVTSVLFSSLLIQQH